MTQALAPAASHTEHFVGLRADHGGEPAFLAALRDRAMDTFLELGFPTPRVEAWRFTNVKEVARTAWDIAPDASAGVDLSPWLLTGAHSVVLVNGRFERSLSNIDKLPEGVIVGGLADALRDHPDKVEEHIDARSPHRDHAFAALNTALFADGAFVWLPPGATVQRPIHLLFLTIGQQIPVMSAPRTLIVAGESAEAAVIEHYAGTGGAYLSCPVTEMTVGANAKLDHVRLQEESPEGRHVAVHQIELSRDGFLRSHAVISGGALARTDVQATLAAEGAHCTLNGLYVPTTGQHIDNHVEVRHAAPHCTSHQLYKGILDGDSRAVFNGRIIVDVGAQKTDARQSNRNLLLSAKALVNSNPQLEIFADDVRCTHGSTVGRLDGDAVFYLRARGLSREAAEGLLIHAFASEVVHEIPIDAVRHRVERLLAARLPHGGLPGEVM